MSFLVSPIIMYRDLLERWECDLPFLLSFAHSDDRFMPAQLTAYKILQTRSCRERGIRGAICEIAQASRTMFEDNFMNDNVSYKEDEICFSVEDVKNIEEGNPLLLCAQEKENESEYMSAHDLRKSMSMSPVLFVDYLREHRDLSVFGSSLSDNDRKWFYKHVSRETAAEMLDDMFIHRLDIEHHRKNISGVNMQSAGDEMPTVYHTMPTAGDDEMPTFESLQAECQSQLEVQLAEALGQVELLRQGHKLLSEQNQELTSKLAEARRRIGDLEKQQPVAMPMVNGVQGKENGAWEASVTAVCKAVVHVLEENRRDWVSGQEKGTGDTDSAGKETFRALLNRMHPQGDRCRVKAETAAWRVISDMGYTHTGGRKPNL